MLGVAKLRLFESFHTALWDKDNTTIQKAQPS